MTTRSAIGAGFLLGTLVAEFARDVLPRFLVPKIARRFL